MTIDEWRRLAALIDNWWGFPPMDEAREASWAPVLVEHPAEAVEAALRRLLLAGGERTPSLAQVLAAVIEIETMPFAEAWELIRGAARRHRGDAEAAGRALAEQSPAVARFARAVGWQTIVSSPVDGEQAARVLRDWEWRWRDFAASDAERERRGLAIEQTERRPLSAPARLTATELLEGGKS